jgi:hypothetical protein
MKMTKKNEKLSEVFNIEPETIEVVSDKDIKINKLSEASNKTVDDIKRDYDYARGNLYSLIEKGQEAINGMLEIAQEGGQPRAYEVAGQLIKNTSEIAEKLLNLQKTLKDIEEDKVSGPTTVNNALFIGSTADLTKLLKQQLTDNTKT